MNEAIQSLLEHIGIDPFNHHHSDSVVQPKSKRPRKNKAVSNATVGPDAQADVPAHDEDYARGDHQEGPASDQEDVHGGGGEEEFHHGLTMDESESYYWSFSEQLWFPLTMNENLVQIQVKCYIYLFVCEADL